MTFKKPENISYTDMCIYIDNNIYQNEFDERLVYEYLYHIIYMLAKKAKLFSQNSYYDDFAIYGANRVYFRLTNKKQWQMKEDGSGYKLDKIKSVLNYIKNLLYPFKVDFEQSEYCQSISRPTDPEDVTYSFNNLLYKNIDKLNFCDFGLTLSDIGKTCKKFLSTLPCRPDSSEWLNIYISVMLTLLNNITLTNRKRGRIEHLSETMRLKESHLNDAFEEESHDAILFHLPKSMHDYILVLTRQLKHIVAKDLSDILNTNVSSDMVLSVALKECIESCEEYQDEH